MLRIVFLWRISVILLTFYVFSSENWKRPKTEINFLFKIISNYFSKEIDSVISQGIRINIIGELKKLSPELKKVLKKSIQLTKKNKKIIVTLAINYGSKNAIIHAAKNTKKLNIRNFEKNIFTKHMPNPDILIRTGGHKRLSNFMLWQLAYAEFFFLKKLWPDFNSNDLIKIIKKFKSSKRNFGAI